MLAVFKEMNADITVYSLIFGESIFNDAIAVVMYKAVLNTSKKEASDNATKQFFLSLEEFAIVFLGSVIMGAVTALIIAFILKRRTTKLFERTHNRDKRRQLGGAQSTTQMEIALFVLCPWVTYLIAEGIGISGIVAIMVNGIFLSIYGEPNISASSRRVLKAGFETVAHSAETLVFIFLGMALFAFKHPYEEMGSWMIPLTIINLSVARLLNVGVVSYLVNKSRTQKIVTRKLQFVMWIAGLRGAMAYALALKSTLDFPQIGKVILITTLIYAFISILIVGSLLHSILQKMDVVRKTTQDGEDAGREEDVPDNKR